MIRPLVIFSLVTVFLVSCSQEDQGVKDKVKSNLELRAEMLSKIDSLEAVMAEQNLAPESPAMGELLRSYIKFSELFPGDQEKAPEYLYKAAALSRAVDLPVKAIKLYDQVLNRYPNWEKAPEVAFLIGFTYDEDLKEVDLAKTAYREVITDFPGDHWALQAEQRLETIDLSEEELLDFLKKKAAESEAQSGT